VRRVNDIIIVAIKEGVKRGPVSSYATQAIHGNQQKGSKKMAGAQFSLRRENTKEGSHAALWEKGQEGKKKRQTIRVIGPSFVRKVKKGGDTRGWGVGGGALEGRCLTRGVKHFLFCWEPPLGPLKSGERYRRVKDWDRRTGNIIGFEHRGKRKKPDDGKKHEL